MDLTLVIVCLEGVFIKPSCLWVCLRYRAICVSSALLKGSMAAQFLTIEKYPILEQPFSKACIYATTR